MLEILSTPDPERITARPAPESFRREYAEWVAKQDKAGTPESPKSHRSYHFWMRVLRAFRLKTNIG